MGSIEVFAGNIAEVGLIQSLLDKDGIKSWLRDEIMGTLNPWYVVPGGAGAIKVLVLKADFDQAKSIVEAYERSYL
jgi:Putative prokaryotic signal transducing protein